MSILLFHFFVITLFLAEHVASVSSQARDGTIDPSHSSDNAGSLTQATRELQDVLPMEENTSIN